MPSRSFVEACDLRSVGDDELKELWRLRANDIICTDNSRIVRLRWAGELPPFRTSGVSGNAHVLDVHPAEELHDSTVRVHFCRTRPCKVCFNGTAAPQPWAHLVALCCVSPDAAHPLADFRTSGALAAASLSDAAASPQASSGATSSSISTAVEKDGPAFALAERESEARMRDTANAWKRVGVSVGIFALLVWAVESKREIQLWLREEYFLKVVQTWAPWAKHDDVVDTDGGVEDEWPVSEVLGCIVYAVPGTTNRAIRMPTSELEVLQVNHFMPLVPNPLGKTSLALAAHPPCDGSLCGGRGTACVADLVRQTMRFGKIPINVVADGCCAFDTLLYLRGQRRCAARRKAMRLAICRDMCEKASDPRWQNVFRRLEGEQLPEEATAPTTKENKSDAHGDADVSAGEPSAGDPSLALAAGDVAPAGDSSLALADGEATLKASVDIFLPKDGRRKGPMFCDAELSRIVCNLTDGDKATLLGATAKEEEEGKAAALASAAMKRATRRNAEALFTKEKDATRIAEHCASRGINPHDKLPHGFYKVFFPAVYGPEHATRNAAEFCHDGKKGRSLKSYWNRRLKQWRDSSTLGVHKLTISTKNKRARRRVSGKQGAPIKSHSIEEELVQRLGRLRRKGFRVTPKLFLQMARGIRVNLVRIAIKKGQPIKIPVCDGHWSRRVRARNCISLRRPNVRWKVSLPVLRERQRITWGNVYRFRAAIKTIFGYDPEIWSFDQKPFHHDESGSKDIKTLDVLGAVEVPLRENHAQTRKRWSATTFCLTNVERARQIPFGECLFEGGERVSAGLQKLLEELRASGHEFLHLRTNDSASYRIENILDMLEDALEPMSPGRDWRILMCDAYKAHLDESIKKLAWSRGYIVIYQGGGTTGVGQVNDTDLHEHLSRNYMDLEQQSVIDQCILDDSACPDRTREDCIRDFCTVYNNPDLHAFAARGFKRRGLSINLDGTEDEALRGTAAKIFHQVQMPALRDIIVSDMTKECEAGARGDGTGFTWSYENVYGAMEDFPKRGQMDTMLDGQENVAPLEEDEKDWSDRGDVSDDDPEPAPTLASAAMASKGLEDLRAQLDWQAAEHKLVSEGFLRARVRARVECLARYLLVSK